jgi:hypothetical protein
MLYKTSIFVIMLFMNTSKIRTFLIYAVAVGIGLGIAKFGFDFMTAKLSPGQPAVAQKTQTKPSDRSGDKSKVEAAQVVSPVVPITQHVPPAAVLKKEEPLANPPANEKKPDSSSYILTGVYFSGNKAFALINNQIVEEGDEIADAKVFKINLDEVILKLADDQIIKLTTRSRYP